MNYEELTFTNRDVALHAIAAGPMDGPVALLLHGFPEFWYGWRRQIEPLAAAGYRVVVPDQRGYNLSSKPKGVKRYAVAELASDVLCIVEQLRRDRIFLIGHDWGAMVAWSFAAWYPAKVERLVIINVPHPAVMSRFLLTHPRQLLRSWYMFFFQIPRLPELLFGAQSYRGSVQSLIRSSRPGTFSESDPAHYRKAWSQPGAATAMIHWYRALLRYRPVLPAQKIQTPVLILWGKEDAFLLPELAPASVAQCQDAKLIPFENATHWVQHEEAEAVNAAILNFLAG